MPEGVYLSEENKIFEGLKPEHFQHPWDLAAIRNLKRVKGMDLFTKKIHGAWLREDYAPSEHW